MKLLNTNSYHTVLVSKIAVSDQYETETSLIYVFEIVLSFIRTLDCPLYKIVQV